MLFGDGIPWILQVKIVLFLLKTNSSIINSIPYVFTARDVEYYRCTSKKNKHPSLWASRRQAQLSRGRQQKHPNTRCNSRTVFRKGVKKSAHPPHLVPLCDTDPSESFQSKERNL
ncbi:hypothetical protein CDAR_472201 [Caerostris darwini]|uniref:Secreted protein n=1 Tax=Caerostris darwini TaxID=1538125 RepID=A0AAV4VM17_9ARAC|nr:hypothetical protein CDAR_472201 [Caerostris darwini]